MVNAQRDARVSGTPWALLFVAVCLVAVNMRMTITGVGPLLDEIAADQGVTPASLGFLASIPLLTWAVVSPAAQALSARIGPNAAVAGSLAALTLGTVWRSLPGPQANLWLGTALVGAALAVANVLLPATIKRDFGGRVPLVMGAYSTLLSGAAAVGAGMVAPIAHASMASGEPVGWRIALLTTGAMVPPALVMWVVATRRAQHRGGGETTSVSATVEGEPSPGTASRLGSRIWRDPVAWSIAVYMGTQSSTFYVWATWLAPLDLSRGSDPVTAGLHVMVFHVCGMFGSLSAPFISRGAMRRILPVLLPVIAAAGAVGLILAPAALLAWLILSGFSAGCALTVSLTLMAQRSTDAATAAATSGMSQSVGYLIAAVGPVLFGVLYGATGSWIPPLFVILAGVGLQFCAGLLLARERMVFGSGIRPR